MTRLCAIAATLMAAAVTSAADPLTIGSPAPKFEVPAFLLGETVKELKRGTIYVIEFSETQCSPCVRCMPLLTELQKKHPDVVVVSVYPQPEKDVREHMAKHRDKIGYRVAVDPEAKMNAAWMEAAYQRGIPCAFVVDGAGKIAWIGYAALLAEPLAKIVAGTFDPTPDVMRLRLEQGAARQEQEAERRDKLARAEHDRINKLLIAGKLAEALPLTEAAIKEYADMPYWFHGFRETKFYILAKQPATKDAAVEFAVELAVEAKLRPKEFRCTDVAGDLINAASDDDPKKRDVRLLDLAIALLRAAEDDLRFYAWGRSETFLTSERISIRWNLGRAYDLRGDPAAAVRATEDAIKLLKAHQPDPVVDPVWFAKERDAKLARFTADLARYKQAAESLAKDK